MAAISVLIEEARSQGYSFRHIAKKTGVGVQTVVRCDSVSYVPTRKTFKKIEDFYYKEVQKGFPEKLRGLRARIQLIRTDDSLSFTDRESMLQETREAMQYLAENSQCNWAVGSARWLEALSGFVLRYEIGSTGVRPSANDIAKAYREAHDSLIVASEEVEGSNLESKSIKLLAVNGWINSFSSTFNDLEVYQRSRSESIRKQITMNKIVEACNYIVSEQPWNWMQARNVLALSSILQDSKGCVNHWAQLKDTCADFNDLNFTPPGYKSILTDPDYWWFRANILREI